MSSLPSTSPTNCKALRAYPSESQSNVCLFMRSRCPTATGCAARHSIKWMTRLTWPSWEIGTRSDTEISETTRSRYLKAMLDVRGEKRRFNEFALYLISTSNYDAAINCEVPCNSIELTRDMTLILYISTGGEVAGLQHMHNPTDNELVWRRWSFQFATAYWYDAPSHHQGVGRSN